MDTPNSGTARLDYAEYEDEELVEIVRQAGPGDTRAFEALLERHQSRVLTNCRYMTRSSANAEDLAQEVFVRAYFGLAKFRGDAAFGTWVRRIKVNHCLNFIRKQERRSGEISLETPGVEAHEAVREEPGAAETLESLDERGRIDGVLDEMVDTLRIPLLMRDLDEMSYREIADALGIGLSAAKMRVKRGRAEFREKYESRFGGLGGEDGGTET
ncbi:MAG: RNA polymerase sigma factor [Gemmatimonadota bacterium]|nr:RNA polymerase sigma factor [Gemmatimonadota bacterium]